MTHRKDVKKIGGLKFFSGQEHDNTGSYKRNTDKNMADEFQ